MLSSLNNITISFKIQQFFCSTLTFEDPDKIVLHLASQLNTKDVVCPHCGEKVHICEWHTMTLKNFPLLKSVKVLFKVTYHRFRCQTCHRSFSEEIPFKHPGTRITIWAAKWIHDMLDANVPIKTIQEFSGIHWDTIKKIHKEHMNAKLNEHKNKDKIEGYKPKYLAVDEFAIHKGHSYATCVMDLLRGDVIWVGKGRSMADFKKFFEEIDMEYLSEVEAFAMDMNASYNRLVSEYMPWTKIVYDRYHMQAQYGREVIGSVRLAEAAKHRSRAKEIERSISKNTDKATRMELKVKAKEEYSQYSKLKGSRWTLLTNESNLNEEGIAKLQNILANHSDLAVCYAMKEEMCAIFDLTDPDEAEVRWKNWFEAAKSSGINALERFATLKEKRLPGLISHAKHPINTGKLEGLNNKTKVAKRLAYGYRDDDYFFTLIRYFTIPSPTFS